MVFSHSPITYAVHSVSIWVYLLEGDVIIIVVLTTSEQLSKLQLI